MTEPLILIVDDNPTILRTYARICERAGKPFVEAEGVDEAIRFFNAHESIRLVISDWEMSPKDGGNLFTSTRKELETREGQFAFISGSTHQIPQWMKDHDRVHVLEKPVFPKTVEGIILDALHSE